MSKVSRNKYAIDCTILSNFICSTLLTLVNFLYLLLYLYIEEGMFVYQVYIFTDGLSIVKRKNKIALQEKKLVYVYHVKYVIFISEDRFLACACVLVPSIRKLTLTTFLIYLRSLIRDCLAESPLI